MLQGCRSVGAKGVENKPGRPSQGGEAAACWEVKRNKRLMKNWRLFKRRLGKEGLGGR